MLVYVVPLVAPGELSAWIINMSAILFSWQCTEEYKTGYIILCQQYHNMVEFWIRNVTNDVQPCTHLVQGIRSSIVFTCMVASFNDVGLGTFSNPVTTAPQFDGTHVTNYSMYFEIAVICLYSRLHSMVPNCYCHNISCNCKLCYLGNRAGIT